jgi:hypothetical protein
MSDLFNKQVKLTRLIANLIIFAKEQGYELTFGDAYRDERATFPYSHDKSLHKKRLAVDFNVFRNGRLLRDGNSFIELGEFWENMGGTWGGRFKNSDGCHFSIEHEGMK